MAEKNEICVGRKVIRLTPKDKKEIKNKNINTDIVEQRLREGWSKKNAVSLRSNFVTKNGDICWVKAFPLFTLYIPLKEYKKVNIEKYRLESNFAKGKTMEEIIKDDFEYFIESNERTKYDLSLDDLQRKRKAEKEAKERHKKAKPWLYDGTPQAVKPSEWFKYLCENDLMKKAVR